MLPILVLCLAMIGLPTGPRSAAEPAIREEPGVVTLPDRPTVQAVVADVGGTGTRDLVRLASAGDGRVVLELWRETGGRWSRVGDDVVIVPELSNGAHGDLVYEGTPLRLLVRAVDRGERVTVVRQPRFASPGLDPPCCMVLHDVVVTGGDVELEPVASLRGTIDTLLAIDLDGDGTDELLATRWDPPGGRAAGPTEVLVLRWHGAAFGAPTVTELPLGVSDPPFILGETDGRPGEEAGIETLSPRPAFWRITLADADRVEAQEAALPARLATSVATDDGPLVAAISSVSGLTLHEWPDGSPIGPPMARHAAITGRFLGQVRLDGRDVLLVEERADEPVVALALPDFAPVALASHSPEGTGAAATAATALGAQSLRPYRGPLPGGTAGGDPAVIVDGVLVPSRGGEPVPMVAFGGSQPIGLAGTADGWLAVLHGGAAPDLRSGSLEPPEPAGGRVSLAPIGLATTPEADGGAFAPEILDAVPLDDGSHGIPATGFSLVVRAPPFSSVVLGGAGEGGGLAGPRVVPDGGRLHIEVPVPDGLVSHAGDRVLLGVVTPSGGTYTASVDVVALTGPPPLAATTRTLLGSTVVEIEGRTAPYVEVVIGGEAIEVDAEGRFAASVELPPWPTDVEVSAIDPAGNRSRVVATGVGLLDYRALPWVAIVTVLILAAGGALYVRTPRHVGARLQDGALEELDPDEPF